MVSPSYEAPSSFTKKFQTDGSLHWMVSVTLPGLKRPPKRTSSVVETLAVEGEHTGCESRLKNSWRCSEYWATAQWHREPEEGWNVKLDPREMGNLASSSTPSCVLVAVCARQDQARNKTNAIAAYRRFMRDSLSGHDSKSRS